MEEITLGNLKQMISFIIDKFPDRDVEFYRSMLSTEVLRILVGNEWVNQSLFPKLHKIKSEQTKESKDFLKSEFKNEFQQFQWQNRMEILAERVFNLQNIKNIGRIIGEIKQGNFSSRYAELEMGAHIARAGINFEYIIPSGKKGNDFDILIKDTLFVNCEIKQKLEESKLGKENIYRVLSKGVSQMPKNEPSLLGLEIPEKWVKNPEIEKLMNNVLKKIFTKNKNLLGIIFRWEIRDNFHPGVFYFKFILERNKDNIFANKGASSFLDRLNKTSDKNWVKFNKIINDIIKKPLMKQTSTGFSWSYDLI